MAHSESEKTTVANGYLFTILKGCPTPANPTHRNQWTIICSFQETCVVIFSINYCFFNKVFLIRLLQYFITKIIYSCSPIHNIIILTGPVVRNKCKRESSKRGILEIVSMEWNGSLELDRSEVEECTCQVIIISYTGFTSHLTELVVFNLKW